MSDVIIILLVTAVSQYPGLCDALMKDTVSAWIVLVGKSRNNATALAALDSRAHYVIAARAPPPRYTKKYSFKICNGELIP